MARYQKWLALHGRQKSAASYEAWFREECAAGRPPDAAETQGANDREDEEAAAA